MNLSAEAQSAIAKIEKLLALARNNSNEAEASSAMNMAHQILERHNLDMALVERQAGQSTHAKREDKSSGGGLYKWQRAVWESTAKLNMCVYIAIKGTERGAKYENRLVGKPENVLMTRLMAEYLQEAIERLAAEWAKERGYSSRFVREAIIFREGMAETIGRRLRDLFDERIEQAKAAKQDAEDRGDGTALVVVLSDVIEAENDLNEDHLKGLEPGTTGRLRLEAKARKLAAQDAQKVAEAKRKWWKNDRDAFTEFYGAEAAGEQMNQDAYDEDLAKWYAGKYTDRFGKGYRENRSRSRGYSYSYRETEEDRRRSHSAHRQGRAKGEEVNLDRQMGAAKHGALR